MGPTCQRCGADLVEFGEPDADGWVTMICPASPNCTEVSRTRKKVEPKPAEVAGE